MHGFDFSLVKPAFLVLGANTGVGKTLVSAALCAALGRRVEARGKRIRQNAGIDGEGGGPEAGTVSGPEAGTGRMGPRVLYVKPWQTGYPADSDARAVREAAPGTETVTVEAFPEPVSPHRAARAQASRGDGAVMASLVSLLHEAPGAAVVEGAGGVASPTPEGRLQCDVLRAARMPVVLVGDPRLGGIGATIASLEMLETRGFEIAAVVVAKGEHENAAFLARHLRERGTSRSVAPGVVEFEAIGEAESLASWSGRCAETFDALAETLVRRIPGAQRLAEETRAAAEAIWWPFTQHRAVGAPGRIESALGDRMRFAGEGPLFDACASWWTQCLGHADIRLVRAAANAAGRYGHVMFPENVHAPAAELARALVEGVGRGWASRAFFSDNGSTATEVGLKMAFRMRLARMGREARSGLPLEVVGLRDSYHGDTLGAMDAASPNAFNLKEPWYRGRGHWLPFPTVRYVGGEAPWHVEEGAEFLAWRNEGEAEGVPNAGVSHAGLSDVGPLNAEARPAGATAAFRGADALFAEERARSALAASYLRAIEASFDRLDREGRVAGAVILEPVVHGSGGMTLVDPLFQRVLVRVAKARGIPVVYDEVFMGLWRIGFERAADALHETPDVACYSKSLTGGLVPLGATLATAEVFESFLGEGKLDALLHGHSYTAYPVGCAVAAEALAALADAAPVRGTPTCAFPEEGLAALARHPRVESAWALGCVFAFTLKEGNGGGYASLAARETVRRLRAEGVYARPLGNVLYGVVSLNTPHAEAASLLATFVRVLDHGT